MRRMRKLTLVVLLLIVLWMAGCAGTFTQNTYRSLYISGKAYDTSMKIVSDLQKQGIIDQAARDKINVAATSFYNAYQGAVNSFDAYLKVESPVNKDKVVMALNMLSAAWPEFAKLVNARKAGTMAPTFQQALKDAK